MPRLKGGDRPSRTICPDPAACPGRARIPTEGCPGTAFSGLTGESLVQQRIGPVAFAAPAWSGDQLEEATIGGGIHYGASPHRHGGFAWLSRSVVLVGFVASAVGLATVTYLIFPGVWSSPGGWTSHDVAVLISLAGSTLFYVLFGWAFWLWLPRLDRGSRPVSAARVGLGLLAATGLLLALAYSAETYPAVRLTQSKPNFGRFGLHVLLCVAYGVMALGFAVAAIGFWEASLTFKVSSGDHHHLASTTARPPWVRARAWVIGGGLAVGAEEVIVSTWPYRISYTGAIAKAQVIFGCSNALALVFMAVGFTALLVDRQT